MRPGEKKVETIPRSNPSSISGMTRRHQQAHADHLLQAVTARLPGPSVVYTLEPVGAKAVTSALDRVGAVATQAAAGERGERGGARKARGAREAGGARGAREAGGARAQRGDSGRRAQGACLQTRSAPLSQIASRVHAACLPSPWPQGEGKGEGSTCENTPSPRGRGEGEQGARIPGSCSRRTLKTRLAQPGRGGKPGGVLVEADEQVGAGA